MVHVLRSAQQGTLASGGDEGGLDGKDQGNRGRLQVDRNLGGYHRRVPFLDET